MKQETENKTKIWTDIDLDAEGKSVGYYRLPLAVHDRSGDDVGYSVETIPVVSIRNGDGPRVLLMAGNHGNEYEGQILLMKLIRSLKVEDIRGQIIFLPAANAPAVRADQRISPLDDGNLNRHFPGDPNGSPTAMIAHLIEAEILPRVTYAIDLHSGSMSMNYLPCMAVARSSDPDRFAHSLEMLNVFGMPNSMVIDHSTGGDRAFIGACRRAGVQHMSSELGGGGTISPIALKQAEDGLARILHFIGVLQHPVTEKASEGTRLIHRLPSSDYVYAKNSERGLFEPLVGLGDEITAGQTVGLIHFTTTPWRAAESIKTKVRGIILCRRLPTRTGLGDCIFVLGRPWVGAGE